MCSFMACLDLHPGQVMAFPGTHMGLVVCTRFGACISMVVVVYVSVSRCVHVCVCVRLPVYAGFCSGIRFDTGEHARGPGARGNGLGWVGGWVGTWTWGALG